MVMIANLQYGWTLFVLPIQAAHGWSRPAIQVAFTLFILAETWLLPFGGALIDRFGPRWIVLGAGAMIGLSWVIDGLADSLSALYAGAVIGGVGASLIYGAAVGNALKWFAFRRGLAAGLTAAGFGAGSALTIIPIQIWIARAGYQSAFLFVGLAQGMIVMLVSLAMRAPPPPPPAPARLAAAVVMDRRPTEVLRTGLFYLLYLMFVLVCAGGLMATAQLAVIAKDFGVAATPVSLLGLTLPALTFALSLDRVLNGVTRPFFGWVSDLIGRELTMFIAFGLEGISILCLVAFAADPVAFVLLSGCVFFAWGEIYSLFPAICADLFGRRHAAANYGMLYTAKGTAALLVPLASVIQDRAGGWTTVFYVAALANLAASFLAIAVLAPWRRRYMARSAAELGGRAAPAVADPMPAIGQRH
jgi:OFA family oxalate/formate antiporter-like MFS transporter